MNEFGLPGFSTKLLEPDTTTGNRIDRPSGGSAFSAQGSFEPALGGIKGVTHSKWKSLQLNQGSAGGIRRHGRARHR